MIEPWNAADIDADFGEIRHRVYIKPGANSADVESRRSQVRVWRDIEVKGFQRRQYTRGFVGCIHAEMRHRSVSGDALEGQPKPKGAFVSDQCGIGCGLRHHDRAGTPENAGAGQMKRAFAA